MSSCKHEYRYNGRAQLTHPPKYGLECTKCGHTIWVREGEPVILSENETVESFAVNDKVIEAGENLAEAAARVCRDYDGIHRLRLALSEWYRVRANEGGRG